MGMDALIQGAVGVSWCVSLQWNHIKPFEVAEVRPR
jgi:hypothetical protein